MLDIAAMETRAADYRRQSGGRYFAFPIDPSHPMSRYAVAAWSDGRFRVFPYPLTVEEAAAGMCALIEGVEQTFGGKVNYDRDVRFFSYDAQMDGPSVTMRRLKKSGEFTREAKGYLKHGEDVTKSEEASEERYLFSGRGLVKYSYLLSVDEKNPKAERFMDGYYRLLALRRYGKTAAAIKQEVRRMDKDAAIRWIEYTYEQYIEDETPIFELLQKQ